MTIRDTLATSYEETTPIKMLENAQIVTNFNQLHKLKARSRLPIDISESLGASQSTINFSSYTQNEIASPKIEKKESKTNKYFSFISKIYENNSRRSLNKASSSDIEEKSNLSSCSSAMIPSSSSIASNTSNDQQSIASADSACCTGSIISSNSTQSCSMRSSILSHNDELDDTINSSAYPNPDDVQEMKKLCHKFLTKINAAKANRNLSNSLSSTKSTQQPIAEPEQQYNAKKSSRKRRVLTILFDYNAPKLSSFVSSVAYKSTVSSDFFVRQGETVHLIEDVNEKYYLVAKISDVSYGYVPKDYTIDLKEVKKKLKTNMRQSCSANFEVKLTHL